MAEEVNTEVIEEVAVEDGVEANAPTEEVADEVASAEDTEVDRLAALEERIAKLAEALEAATQPLTKAKKNKGSKPPSLNTQAELPKIEEDATLTKWQREELYLKQRKLWIAKQTANRP